MNELVLPNIDIVTDNQQIILVGYETLDKQLDQLGEYLSSVEVTQENIKENKKLVAQVRKACNDLNTRRIAFKKEYMKPLTTLENQIKQLDQKAKHFEDHVRDQIKELEEKEREEKYQTILDLFNKRLRIYGSDALYPFKSFFYRSYLNKSYSMNKIEEEMVEWFENRQNDINALIGYSETIKQSKDEVIAYYLECNNLTVTISHFAELNQTLEKVSHAVSTAPRRANKPQPKTSAVIKVLEDDLERVKQLLTASGISFEIL